MKKIILILCLLILIPVTALADDFDFNQNHHGFNVSTEEEYKARLTNLTGKDVWADQSVAKAYDLKSLKNLEHLVITSIDITSGVIKFTRDNGEIITYQPILIKYDRNKEDTNKYPYYISCDLWSCFFLKNPYELHPDWSSEVWEKIKDQKVSIGMSREMCLLSWGTPHHDYHKTIDIAGVHEVWSYSEAQQLFFTNGLLTRIDDSY